MRINKFIYQRIKALWVSLRLLSRGDVTIFKLQKRSRQIIKMLDAIQINLNSSMPPKIASITDSLIKRARELDREATYHISLELSRRRQKSLEKKARFSKSIYQECPICYNEFPLKVMVRTSCCHIFCRRCIGRYSLSSDSCPSCRNSVRPSSASASCIESH